MKLLLRLLKYILRYKKALFLSILLGFFASLLNIFSIFAFKPVLDMMFSGLPSLSGTKTNTSVEKPIHKPKYKLPIVRSIERKIKPYREAIDSCVDRITAWAIAHKMKALYIIGIVVAFSALLKGMSAYASDYLMLYTGISLVKDIRQEIHDHILRMDLPFFGKRSIGQLMARVSSDVSAFNSAMVSAMDVGIQSPISIIMILVFMYYLSPQLTFFSVVALPFVALWIAYFGRRIRRVSRRAQERTADVVDIMQETYGGIRVVKAFGMEEFESRRFQKANVKAYRSYLHRQALRKLTSPLMEIAGVLAVVIVLLAGGYLILKAHTLSGTNFFVFLIAVSRLYRPLKDLSGIHVRMQSGLAGAERVFEILDTESKLKEKPDAIPMPPLKQKISFGDVSFSYDRGNEYALKNIGVDIMRGSITALVGRSGAGKTTFANLLCRFYDPTDGCITFDGIDLKDFSIKALRERIGIVTQETFLFSDTVRNNIAYGRTDIPLESVIEAAKEAYAHDFIEKLPQGYDTPIGEGGGRLSGGERQRIAIARAILKNPDILVLDEATSSLDSEAEAKIQEAIKNLIRGRTTLIIAHRLSTVKMADEILVLDDGRLVERGTHDELLRRQGQYAYLCRLQGIFIDTPQTISTI